MNTKHPLYKEKLKLEREIYELEQIQRNQNWIELKKPYKHGYYKVFDLREDIKNRDDAWVFYECIRLVGKKAWWKDKSFKKKIKKGKYEYISPGFGQISQETYDGIHPAVKKYFAEIQFYDRRWNPFRKTYECVAPSYYFVEKIKPHYITHYKEFDNVIQQEVDEKHDELYYSKKFYHLCTWRTSAPKDYCKSYHRSDRNHNKKALHRNLMNGGEDCDKYEYRYNHKHSATWDYW